jgi:hypothetical protein
MVNNLLIDDMEIAPDFFDYFEAAAKLLDNDKYVVYYILIIVGKPRISSAMYLIALLLFLSLWY